MKVYNNPHKINFKLLIQGGATIGQAQMTHSVASSSKELGVKFVSSPEGTMESLYIVDGKLSGINVVFGNTHIAAMYILCTGAASPALLPELSTQLWSKCWTLADIEVTDSEMEEYRGMPVVDNHELGFFFEPDPETKWVKICNATQGYEWKTATNKEGLLYSVPQYASNNPTDGIPKEAEEGIRRFIDAIAPQFSGRPLKGARICWRTDTPNQHFLFCESAGYPELLLGTGDSGHGFKFLPTIGKYIADAGEGKEFGLKPEWRWRQQEWERDRSKPNDEVKDLRDVGLGQ